MPVPFTEFQALYPPHPALSWNPETVHPLRGYLAQYKYDDGNTDLLLPGRIDSAFQPEQAATPPLSSSFIFDQRASLARSSPQKFHVLDGGLLHIAAIESNTPSFSGMYSSTQVGT